MSEDFEAPKDDLENEIPEGSEGHSDYKPADTKDVKAKYQLSGNHLFCNHFSGLVGKLGL